MLGSRRTVDLAVQIGRDPAAVKIAGLWNNTQIADKSLVHQPGIGCHKSCKCGKAWRGAVVGPGGTQGSFSLRDYIEMMPYTLPFANAADLRRAQLGQNIARRQVIAWRMMGFQHPQGAGGIRHQRTTQPNHDPLRHWLQCGGAGIGLNVLRARSVIWQF